MQTLSKYERLSSKIAITNLFETGKSFYCSPFKIVWQEVAGNISPAQIVISVPKRLFKKAVDRNRLKRLAREVYRKHKNIIYDKLNNKKIILLFIFTSKTMIDYKEMEEKIIIALHRLNKNINSEILN